MILMGVAPLPPAGRGRYSAARLDARWDSVLQVSGGVERLSGGSSCRSYLHSFSFPAQLCRPVPGLRLTLDPDPMGVSPRAPRHGAVDRRCGVIPTRRAGASPPRPPTHTFPYGRRADDARVVRHYTNLHPAGQGGPAGWVGSGRAKARDGRHFV